jgi:hypothetical protein
MTCTRLSRSDEVPISQAPRLNLKLRKEMRLNASFSVRLPCGPNVCAALQAATFGEKWRMKRGWVTLSGNGMLPIKGLACRGR